MIKESDTDCIIIGAGMGGLTAAAMLANDGYRVLVLEAAHVPGGCSSSYKRKGYVFETGATTLIGFDENQPLRYLEEKTGIRIPRTALEPSMAVHQNGKVITRYRNRERWIEEAISHFGNEKGQRGFWKLAFDVSDVVWKVSLKNPFFPPNEVSDWFRLLTNNPLDARVLPYALKSVKDVVTGFGIDTDDFLQFLDEQLMISAQSYTNDTPFLFGAPAVTYTNYTNYNVPGGLLTMAETMQQFIEEKGGELHVKEKVLKIQKVEKGFQVFTSKNESYSAPVVISNLPVWNMPGITGGDIKYYFERESSRYEKAWGAVTMGIVTDDEYPDEMPLHHQIHFSGDDVADGIESGSLFVSLSHRDDKNRLKDENHRILNISTHALPEWWFSRNGDYDAAKKNVENFILKTLNEKLPGFSEAQLHHVFTGTPVTWDNWVYRKKGRVGGIPQSMERSLLDWTPNQTPFAGLYLCGDTVYPGQGIPGVTLSGINVYRRVIKNLAKS